MPEIIKIMEARELPLSTQTKFNVFEGLVEVRVKKDSPPQFETVRPFNGTFSDRLFQALKKGDKKE